MKHKEGLKKRWLAAAICLLMAIATAPPASAQTGTTDDILSSNNVLSIKGISESTNEVENFKNFEVEVLTAGDYYAHFWVMPARYTQGGYTSFKVYVNGAYVGLIQPTRGNWQSATVHQHPTLPLRSGSNVISVATAAPEFPNVETVRLSRNAQAATLSTTAYDSYLEEAKEGNGAVAEPASSLLPFNQIPLKYSFYHKFSFNEGQKVTISSTSSVPHAIDVFYYGYRTTLHTQNSGEGTASASIDPNLIITPPIGDGDKLEFVYTPATPEEIQGLNWKRISTPSRSNSTLDTTAFTIHIHKTGLYMVKLRSLGNRVLSVADLTVDESYQYDDVPIYYSRLACEMPADVNMEAQYTAYAKGNLSGSDPMLFVEGADGERIVGYNDDTSVTVVAGDTLSDRDSYIRQPYKIKTVNLHISSYNSASAESLCLVKGGILGNFNPLLTPTAPANSQVQATAGTSALNIEIPVSITPQVARLSSAIEVAAQEEITTLRVFNMSGTEVAAYPIHGYRATIPLAELNITQAGVYLFRVETSDLTVTHQQIIVH